MIEEKYLQMAINIRRTYLKLMNNMDLYRARALQVSEKLEDTVKKLESFQSDLEDKNKNITQTDAANQLLKIINEVEDEGKRLEGLIDPINVEIEKLSKEEMELYKQIVNSHPNLEEDKIVKIVQDRLIKEGLS